MAEPRKPWAMPSLPDLRFISSLLPRWASLRRSLLSPRFQWQGTTCPQGEEQGEEALLHTSLLQWLFNQTPHSGSKRSARGEGEVQSGAYCPFVQCREECLKSQMSSCAERWWANGLGQENKMAAEEIKKRNRDYRLGMSRGGKGEEKGRKGDLFFRVMGGACLHTPITAN